MKVVMRPVSVGLILGLLGLIFGIAWASYLASNHDDIHRRLAESRRAAIEQKFVLQSGGEAPAAHHSHGAQRGAANGHGHSAAREGGLEVNAQEHDDPVMEEAHERLTRGHLHAMGLGILAISVSLVLGFIPAPHNLKTLASACLGTGGIFYPLSWILMGLRTVTLGQEAAARSVIPIAGLSMLLVVTGIVITLVYLLRYAFKGE
ncbi:MAG: hypothetical protein Q8P48_04550 [Deltaproteobacteria bacterium]|nr:hypothetical protein [Deltaproteobacteria bacterium]